MEAYEALQTLDKSGVAKPAQKFIDALEPEDRQRASELATATVDAFRESRITVATGAGAAAIILAGLVNGHHKRNGELPREKKTPRKKAKTRARK